MTVLVCDFRSVVGDAVHGTVTVESAVDRPAQQIPGAVITPVREEYKLRDGQCVVDGIDPGPVVVELSAEGVFRRWEVSVPEDGRHQFSTMLEDQVQWTPAILSQVQELNAEMARYAAAAGKSATAAKQAETRVAAVVADGAGALRVEIAGTLREVDERLAAAARMRDESRAAAVEAAGHADRAEAAAGRAAEDAATEVAPLVAQSRDDRAAVEAAAERVDSTATQVAGEAESVRAARLEAVQAAGRASTSASRAAESEERTVAARDSTEQSQKAAAASEIAAADSRDAAEDAARRAGAHADTVDVQHATSERLGLVKLSGDLAGTAEVPSVPRLAELDGKADREHTHGVTDIAGLQPSLSGKADKRHQHTVDDVDGLSATLDGKSNMGHGHAISDVSGLSAALAARAERSHTHSTAQITGLDTALQGKAEKQHTHTSSDVSDTTGVISRGNIGRVLAVGTPSDSTDAYVWVGDDAVLYVNKGSLVIAAEADAKSYIRPSQWYHIANKRYVDEQVQQATWNTSGCEIRDDGSMRLGGGGTETYKWRVDRGLFTLFFDIRWGTYTSSRGGPVKIRLPMKNDSGVEAIGTGSYWSSAGNFGFVLTPTVSDGDRELTFLVSHHGDTSTMQPFRIWDGRRKDSTGIPGNPGFAIDARGSSIKGTISFPV
ncbi:MULTISPECIES: hypothetical protein [Corynebacterium]|uniref:hypothetical protein n=1 Tax=Corynebacterium TaxID=1716 RepID=UPI00124DB1D3|nr:MULTISPECIES: hypothetical protein [Corynebacterium]